MHFSPRSLAAFFAWLALAAVACLPSGCATHADQLRDIRVAYYSGDVARAEELVDRQIEKRKHDGEVLKLEKAMLRLAAGEPREAERILREVRDRFDYLEQPSVAEEALSFATDETRKAYAGEDYEKVLIRAMLALSNLMGDGQDATAYSLQVMDKQRKIIEGGTNLAGENPKLSYRPVALGPYVHGALREVTHAHYDEAERAWAQVVSWQPEFPYGTADLERTRHGHHSGRGNGVLYVFALVGRGPYKEEVAEMPTTAALFLADRILSHTSRHTLPPTLAPVKVPAIVLPQNIADKVIVDVDGQARGTTETITNVSQLALQQHQAVYDEILARAVVRRIVKKGAVYASKDVLNSANIPAVNVALDVAGVAWEATEAADTRCWGLLPEKIQVLRLELPAGEHRIALQTLDPRGGRIGSPHGQTVHVPDGGNAYLLASFPGAELVGEILVAGQ